MACVLLLHFNGTDGSTTFTDEMGKTITPNGNTQIDTAQSVFGGSSGLFDGNGDYLSLADSTDWAFGNGNATIDFRIKTSQTGDAAIIGQANSTGTGAGMSWYFRINGFTSNKISFYVYDENLGHYVTSTTSINDGVWHHIAGIIYNHTIYLYVDGVSEGTPVSSIGTLRDSGNLLSIGRLGEYGLYYNGWIEELRVLKGTSEWTSNFTPYESPYNSDGTSSSSSSYSSSSTSSSSSSLYGYPSSYWTTSGVTLYDAGKINDGTLTAAAFHTDSAAAGSYVQLDLGSAISRNFTGVSVTIWRSSGTPSVYATWNAQYSDNGSSWTTVYTGIGGHPWTGSSTITDTKTVSWSDAGSHRYWRIYKTDTAVGGDYHSEVNFTGGTETSSSSSSRSSSCSSSSSSRSSSSRSSSSSSSSLYGYPSSYWTTSGVSVIDAEQINNGTLTSYAFHTDSAGIGSYVKLDLGSIGSRNFTGVEVTISRQASPPPYATVYATWNIQYSDNDSTWNTVSTGLGGHPWTATSGTTDTKTASWDDAGRHRYWRLYKTDAAVGGDYHSEVNFTGGTTSSSSSSSSCRSSSSSSSSCRSSSSSSSSSCRSSSSSSSSSSSKSSSSSSSSLGPHTIDYSDSEARTIAAFSSTTSHGQAVTVSSDHRIYSCKFTFGKSGNPTGTVVAKIYAASGTVGTDAIPSGAALATSTSIDISSIASGLSYYEFVFSPLYSMNNGNYVIAFEASFTFSDASNYIYSSRSAASVHAGNLCSYNGSWSYSSSYDLDFYLIGSDFSSSSSSCRSSSSSSSSSCRSSSSSSSKSSSSSSCRSSSSSSSSSSKSSSSSSCRSSSSSSRSSSSSSSRSSSSSSCRSSSSSSSRSSSSSSCRSSSSSCSSSSSRSSSSSSSRSSSSSSCRSSSSSSSSSCRSSSSSSSCRSSSSSSSSSNQSSSSSSRSSSSMSSSSSSSSISSSSSSSSYQGWDLTSACIAQWKCNDNAATTTVEDSVGTYNMALNTGKTTSGISISGKINSAFSFEDCSVYSAIADQANLRLDEFTIAAWVYRKRYFTSSYSYQAESYLGDIGQSVTYSSKNCTYAAASSGAGYVLSYPFSSNDFGPANIYPTCIIATKPGTAVTLFRRELYQGETLIWSGDVTTNGFTSAGTWYAGWQISGSSGFRFVKEDEATQYTYKIYSYGNQDFWIDCVNFDCYHNSPVGKSNDWAFWSNGSSFEVNISTGRKSCSLSSYVPQGRWVFVTGSFSRANQRIRVSADGTIRNTTSLGGDYSPVWTTAPICIGAKANATNSNSNFYGLVDNVMFFNKELGSQEIKDLYNFGAGTENLSGSYSSSSCSSSSSSCRSSSSSSSSNSSSSSSSSLSSSSSSSSSSKSSSSSSSCRSSSSSSSSCRSSSSSSCRSSSSSSSCRSSSSSSSRSSSSSSCRSSSSSSSCRSSSSSSSCRSSSSSSRSSSSSSSSYHIWTFDCCPISLRVDDTYDWSLSTTFNNPIYTSRVGGLGTAFIASHSYTLNKVGFYLAKGGSSAGTLTAKVYAVTGTPGVDAAPTGSALSASDSFDMATLTETLSLTTFTFSWNAPNLVKGNYYAVVLEAGGVFGPPNYIDVAAVKWDAYNGNGTWYTRDLGWDTSYGTQVFYCYSENTSSSSCSSSSSCRSSSSSMSLLSLADIGLYTWKNGTKIIIGAQELDVSHKVRITDKNGTIWGIPLVDEGTPRSSGIGISIDSTTKYLPKK